MYLTLSLVVTELQNGLYAHDYGGWLPARTRYIASSVSIYTFCPAKSEVVIKSTRTHILTAAIGKVMGRPKTSTVREMDSMWARHTKCT